MVANARLSVDLGDGWAFAGVPLVGVLWVPEKVKERVGLVLYTLSCSCTSLPLQGGGGALLFGLIGPSCTSPTVLLSGLKVTFSLGSSENPGREGTSAIILDVRGAGLGMVPNWEGTLESSSGFENKASVFSVNFALHRGLLWDFPGESSTSIESLNASSDFNGFSSQLITCFSESTVPEGTRGFGRIIGFGLIPTKDFAPCSVFLPSASVTTLSSRVPEVSALSSPTPDTGQINQDLITLVFDNFNLVLKREREREREREDPGSKSPVHLSSTDGLHFIK
ncbi:hypothetical protein P5673_011097 [Acropora cervicornis]|uniref:Uncharacterized protein n=1 Tax=Acropora cervicornis TaxID=6130 RepID=A0AAD9QPY4_ACRCE|nr:hypothetical protein P5673_011097 [Acropora cervicornis]